MKKYWTTQTGEEIEYKNLKTGHLRNILGFLKRRADEGVEIIMGDTSSIWGEPWGEIEKIYDNDVLERFDYKGLLAELNKRITPAKSSLRPKNKRK